MGKAKLFCALTIVAACDQPETKKVPSNNVSDIYADKNSIDTVDVTGAPEEIFFAEKMDSNEVLDNGQVTLFDSVLHARTSEGLAPRLNRARERRGGDQ